MITKFSFHMDIYRRNILRKNKYWFHCVRISTLYANNSDKKELSNLDLKDTKLEKLGIKQELVSWPSYIHERLCLWDELSNESRKSLESNRKAHIKISLPDGTVTNGTSWETTPIQIAQNISQGLAESAIVAKVNGQVWDLCRPLEDDTSLELLKYEDKDAKQVYWHSTSHLLGAALERIYGGFLCSGPSTKNGFFHDIYMENQTISSLDFPYLKEVVKKISKEKHPFERLEVSKESLLKLFNYNKFKVYMINEKINTPTATVYKCGSFIDLCVGPHVSHSGKIKQISIFKNSSPVWKGDTSAEKLQRVYGISFATSKELKEWQHFQEEAIKRDHRKLGIDQDLFFFNNYSPGSAFFTPKGVFIYNSLIEYIRSEYRKRGFQEVISPNVYSTKLWETSGHWEHFSENMISFELEKTKFALKPMNCPGHCIIYKQKWRSEKDLPIRYSDFGVLHRNEFSGALSGLIRVRRFQQDDAHIFCTPKQIKQEIKSCLDFFSSVYKTFGFNFILRLSTRPDKYLGELELWNQAEDQLTESLQEFEQKWELNPGDGAFYGPKIDVSVTDALGREHQCATVQLDFQLPARFELTYKANSGEQLRPVIIHRAVLGSVERMIAILTESYGGKWPFWMSPRQAMVIPVSPEFNSYASEVRDQLFAAGIEAENDIEGDSMKRKIRQAQVKQFNFILVVGEREQQNQTVNVRTRDMKVHGEHSVKSVEEKFRYLKDHRILHWEDYFSKVLS